MLRLFRRAVVCVIVGAAAFGGVGWLLRPRPIWSVDLAGGGPFNFVLHGDEGPGPNAPIWMVVGRESDPETGGRCAVYESRSATTGRVLARVTASVDDAPAVTVEPVVVDGLLLVHRFVAESKTRARAEFRYFDPFGVAQRSVTLRGKWAPTRDGRRAERIEPPAFRSEPSDGTRPGNLLVGIADLTTGKVTQSLSLPGYTTKEACSPALSPDGRLLAVCEKCLADHKPPFGVEIFDLDTGSHQRVPPPPPRRAGGDASVGSPSFSEDGSFLTFRWGSNAGKSGEVESWRFELATGRSTRWDDILPAPPRTVPYGDEQDWVADSSGVDSHLHVTENNVTDECWFRVEEGGAEVLPWTRFPFPLDPYSDKGSRTAFLKIAGGTELIAGSKEPPLAAWLPERLEAAAPKSWKVGTAKLRWHDWSRGVWREAASMSDIQSLMARPDLIVAVVGPAEGPWVLQGWPLPPRDPKPWAIGAGASAAVGVWVLNGRRYRRRVRRAKFMAI